jgi:hypothetical protein
VDTPHVDLYHKRKPEDVDWPKDEKADPCQQEGQTQHARAPAQVESNLREIGPGELAAAKDTSRHR